MTEARRERGVEQLSRRITTLHFSPSHLDSKDDKANADTMDYNRDTSILLHGITKLDRDGQNRKKKNPPQRFFPSVPKLLSFSAASPPSGTSLSAFVDPPAPAPAVVDGFRLIKPGTGSENERFAFGGVAVLAVEVGIREGDAIEVLEAVEVVEVREVVVVSRCLIDGAEGRPIPIDAFPLPLTSFFSVTATFSDLSSTTSHPLVLVLVLELVVATGTSGVLARGANPLLRADLTESG